MFGLLKFSCRIPCIWFIAVLTLGMAGCANPALKRAQELADVRQHEQALAVIDAAVTADPSNLALRSAQHQQRDRAAAQVVLQVDALRAAGRYGQTKPLLEKLALIQPGHPRIQTLQAEIERAQRHDQLLLEARDALAAGRLGEMETRLREVAAESPSHPGLRALRTRLSELQARESDIPELGEAFQRPVSLEFRDAPLRSVFEALARASKVNFVFDREVRGDTPITVFLRNVTLDEAMRVILGSNQLDRKLLNAESVLIYPATQAKQREHQELVTRTLYLANAEVNRVQNLLKTIAKVRDVYVDERLNLMVIRDTPEVVRLVEKIVASIDLPEPEVMLDVEVMEVASDQLDALGIHWPEQVEFGLPGVSGSVEWSARSGFRATIANPVIAATLRGSAGTANLLANPKIRVRNRDKARVHIGQKLPVFTTMATPNVGVSASVTYLDVGLKLDVEPTVSLDNAVSIRVGLEVSNVLRQVTGPAGSIAYEVGTRLTNTSLRLADGETQIISGLVNDEDRRSASGVPGLSRAPVVGPLFGLNSSTRNKTEVVLLITPRIVRNLSLPDIGVTRVPAGTDAYPGAFSSQLRPALPVKPADVPAKP